MTNTLQPDHQAKAASAVVDRRNLLRGAAAIAATAVTVKAASAETVTPFGETGVPTRSTERLPLGPLSGSRYPDSHLESRQEVDQSLRSGLRFPGFRRNHGG